jgi:Bacterial regulatory helix-turn-helix protein, lysR family
MDRFSELNAFIAVVEAGGFSAAARRRGEGQPGISKAIAALEKRLGGCSFTETMISRDNASVLWSGWTRWRLSGAGLAAKVRLLGPAHGNDDSRAIMRVHCGRGGADVVVQHSC